LKGSSNYAIIVNTEWLPGPPYDRKLIFRNNQFLFQKDDPDCKLPSAFCQFRLSSPDAYSIPALFEQAHRCTNETKAAYMRLNPFTLADFHGLASIEELHAFGIDSGFLLGFPVLCQVVYDPDYGFPTSITSYTPYVNDGAGVLEVTKLELNPTETSGK
jgi:hypothetical protein